MLSRTRLSVVSLFVTTVVVAIATTTLLSGASPENWPQFRGPGGLPVSDNPALPATWSTDENVEWVSDIDGSGWSSPIVWGDKVFITSATSDQALKQPSLGVDFSNDLMAELIAEGKSEEEALRLVMERDGEMPDEVTLDYRLLCLDLASGAVLWDREIYHGPPPVGRHRKNSYTSETPVTDGETVFVYIGHLGLFAYDFAGDQLWNRPVAPQQVYLEFGGGSSPVLHGDRLFILNDTQDDSFVAAFNKRTGEELWHTPRPGMGDDLMRSGWSTPFVWEHEERTELVTNGPGAIISYDLEGDELWRLSRAAIFSIQTPFAADGLLYIATGVPGGDDKPIVAIRPGGSGDITPPENQTQSEHVAWFDRVAGGTYLPTPVVYDGRMYVLGHTGILSVHNAQTGARLYQSRIHPRARNFTASPWAYNGMVFVVSEEGDTFVIKAGDQYELLGINPLDAFTMATPAIAGDRLLIRTQTQLFSIRRAS